MAAVFTSITLSYLAKARVLADSVRRTNPALRFYLVLAEPVPEWLSAAARRGDEPFDMILPIGQLNIPEWRAWLFGHELVEACTGIKGPALRKLLGELGEDRVIYLDPDVVVFDSLEAILRVLDDHAIALTPHCPASEQDPEAIACNEISSLAHGVYNLGFLGVAGDAEGRRFAEWWAHRLYHFCHDDILRGLFVDQRWADLVPAQFDRVAILRDPQYNVASWNVSQRRVSGSVEGGLLCEGRPLCFYHFSGMNAGTPDRIHRKFAPGNRALDELVAWYRRACARRGEQALGQSVWHFSLYEDGQPVTRAQRLYYRQHPELRRRFPDPFAAGPNGYRAWLDRAGPGLDEVEVLYAESEGALRLAAARLSRIEQSRAYRLYRRVRRLWTAIGRRAA
jgi:hypothetical protein